MAEQCSRQSSEIGDLINTIDNKDLSHLARSTVSQILIQDLHLRDITDQVAKRRISSENDFFFAQQLKMSYSGQDSVLSLGMLSINCPYRYEYLGHIKRLVLGPLTQKSFLSLLTAFQLSYFCLLSGGTGVGKSSLVRELASYQGVMFRLKNGSSIVSMESMTGFLKVSYGF